MNKEFYDIVIIGGGASGLMLAANLDLAVRPDMNRNVFRGIILESSPHLGSKLLLTGGGRCNITHGGSIKDFVHAYGDAGPALRRCLYRHSNAELAEWFANNGVPLADEAGRVIGTYRGARLINEAVCGSEIRGEVNITDAEGRVFPASGKAKDVLDALVSGASSNLWQIETGVKVVGLRKAAAGAETGRLLQAGDDRVDVTSSEAGENSEGVWEIALDDNCTLRAWNVVIAAGGITYPETGSDGSMLGVLGRLGLDIEEPRPALAPVYVEDYPYAELAGISVQDVTVTAFGTDAACTCKAKAVRMRGDLLFTHDGFSGPVILNISKYAEKGEILRICYNKELSGLPRRMQNILRERARGKTGDIRTKVLASLLDHDDFAVKGVDRRGMVTAGGVSLDEIDVRTMKVRQFESMGACAGEQDEKSWGAPGAKSLYVIGEALDADGITGGYNLQLCWSTACTCADSIRAGGFI